MSVSVTNLWKRFQLRAPGGGVREHWALRNVDFRIPAGGALGVIGSNGSGKTTLLQLVAGVLRPTSGRVESAGRLLAILNPTAGFHPDLSGRANVSMLGALHGIPKREVEAAMAAIIDFSGLDAWIDEPVKAWSAGMTMRLGFSAAAHLRPAVLVVDEVMSAGDLAFQRRTAGMARALRREGTTLLMSTHALGDLATLCDRLLLLERGEVTAEGNADDVVASYMQRVDSEGGRILSGAPAIAGVRATSPSGDVRIVSIAVNGLKNPDIAPVRAGEPLEITIHWEAEREVEDAVFRVQFFRNDGLFVHGQNTVRHGMSGLHLHGKGSARLRYDHFALLGGDYYLSVGIWPDEYRSYTTGEAYDHRPSACIVHVDAGRSLGGGVAGFPCSWSVEEESRPVLRILGGE